MRTEKEVFALFCEVFFAISVVVFLARVCLWAGGGRPAQAALIGVTFIGLTMAAFLITFVLDTRQ